MIDPKAIKTNMLELLDKAEVEYKLFEHQPVFSYDDALKAQEQTGFFGTEGKSLVLKVDDSFIVYFTIQGKKVSFDAIKQLFQVKKVQLATPEELEEYFGALPGCAYPFGFDAKYSIYVDPIVYQQDWVLFSPCLPTFTLQAKGKDLEKVFANVKNPVLETQQFNLDQ